MKHWTYRKQQQARLEVEIQASPKRSRQTYGVSRMRDDLKDHGTDISLYLTGKIRKKLGIRCKQVKKFKVTTDSKHSHPVAENLLNQEFQASAPNHVWVTDITRIPTDEGCPYLTLPSNTCRAALSSMTIDRQKRGRFCSTENYDNCLLFLSRLIRKKKDSSSA